MINQLNKDNVIRNLSEMIAIDSTTGKESLLAEWIADYLMKLGMKVKWQKVDGKRKNVYTIYRFSDVKPFLTFNGHLDTIPVVNGWNTNPFRPTLEKNRLFGLGSWDMKSGLAALLEVFRVLISNEKKLKGTVAFSAVVDEEAYSLGAKALMLTELVNSDAIILGEPWFGNNQRPTFLGSTGKLLYEVTSQGKAAHAFEPEKGKNAIDDMVKFLNKLEDLPFKNHSLFGFGNQCVLKIEGGYKQYSLVVPEECRVTINRLTVPGETTKEILNDVNKIVQDKKLISKFKIRRIEPSYEPYLLSKKEPIILSFIHSYQKVLHRLPLFAYHRMITDSNIYTGLAKVPTLIFGPRGGNIHMANEYVDLSSIDSVLKIYLLTAIHFLNSNAGSSSVE